MADPTIHVIARTFHTLNGVPHAAGEAYTLTDSAMFETLRGAGFIELAPAGAPTPHAPAAHPAAPVIYHPSTHTPTHK